MKTNIHSEDLREKQRETATEAVKSALYLDEVAPHENISVSDAEVDEEIVRSASARG
jgi:FKBP-type peptidyl-prolyl cis-trans isomerase (trigger factor)